MLVAQERGSKLQVKETSSPCISLMMYIGIQATFQVLKVCVKIRWTHRLTSSDINSSCNHLAQYAINPTLRYKMVLIDEHSLFSGIVIYK